MAACKSQCNAPVDAISAAKASMTKGNPGNVEGDFPMSEGPMNTIGMPGKVRSRTDVVGQAFGNHRASWAV